MTRVSEQSSYHAINHSVNKTKEKLENLQLKGSTLKRIGKPSDDPLGNTEVLALRSRNRDNDQFLRNVSFVKTQLTFVENAIEELTNIAVKAKELAIGQSSSFYDADIRSSVAREIEQLKKQTVSVANRRLGNKYLFGGYKSLSRPYDDSGKYFGDDGVASIEVSKDFFVPGNVPGSRLLSINTDKALSTPNPVDPSPKPGEFKQDPIRKEQKPPSRELASEEEFSKTSAFGETNLIQSLQTLENALVTNNPEIVQVMLPRLDRHIDSLIQLRTQIGSTVNSIDTAESNIERSKIAFEAQKSQVEDADVAELFSDLTRQQNTLNATYRSSAQLMNSSLLDFMR